MFYSHTILARKSPLGTVWIAAHLERKIKKPQIDGIDIPSYAESIMFPEVPIALRLSGHLLLGLVRIYSWKVNYLFQDCNRMVTTIRTAFASVQVDLPVGQDRAPFESITLPATLNLDDLDLDDAISQINTPDNHQKTLDQITLPDESEYVMIDLDEVAGVEPPVTEPTEMFPPFGDDSGSSKNANNEIPVDRPDNLTGNSDEIRTDGLQDPPEKMREAPTEGPGLDLKDLIQGDESPMEVDDPSPFVQGKVITSPVIAETSSAGQQIPGRSVPKIRTPTTNGSFDGPLGFDQLPSWRLEPSPPQVQAQPQVQAPPQVQGNRKRKFDLKIVRTNVYMRKQIAGDNLEKLIHKRRKLPQTALDMWKFSRTNRNDSFFLEPLLSGMCSNLHATYERNYPCVSNPDAECASREPEAGDENYGDQDAAPERQPSPKSPENEDAPPERQASPKSPGTVNAQPESLSTPKSTGAGAEQDDNTLPELPRFSPVDMPSAAIEDSPFKTLTRTPPSRLGETGNTERTPSDWNYSLPGQSTRSSNTVASLFPINEDDDLPGIPGLVNTPGGVSSAGTGVTGLGSMSARTRAVAQFFKDHTSSDEQPGKFSLNGILVGRTRKQAARMFFETTVLKTYDYIDVQQDEPYGDIEVSVKPSLSTVKL